MLDDIYINPEEQYLFNIGELFRSFLKLGAHTVKLSNVFGVHFAVWAPNALKVRLIGDFNNWQGLSHEMKRQGETGVWTLFVPQLKEGTLYKYEILTSEGEILHKADPYAFYSEIRPKTASIVYSLEGYCWQDEAWLAAIKNTSYREKPMLVYEVHLGSWKRKSDHSFFTYKEIAEELISYVQDMGFTHIELLPVMEHPYDGSWGYQITGYYAPTSRFGTPHDLMYLIDRCHQAGIGVILDWVPGHFCKDQHGLGKFDGSDLFENGEHPQWGTYKFSFLRTEVWSFLISNALFWFDIFHIDGLRVDGVTSMIFLDYGIDDGSSISNINGGRENLEALAFLRKLNEVIFAYHPQALMIAEESTDWPLVTRPPYDGGLGFNYKWNMGWMNDTLRYMQTDFDMRRDKHQLLTFSLMYAFSEDFILPLSHDEVVHGKKSLVDKLPGDYWQKFAGLRSLYCLQICHPGKKMLFMGGEIAQFIEWHEYSTLEWFLLEYEMHRKYKEFVKILNHLYLSEKSLWQNDHDWRGFEWLDVNNNEQSILIFKRKASENDYLMIIINFLPEFRPGFRVGVPNRGSYKEIINTDSSEFGGSGQLNSKVIRAESIPWHNQNFSLQINIPPLAGIILKPVIKYNHLCSKGSEVKYVSGQK